MPPVAPPARRPASAADAFDALASLLEYPREGFAARARAAGETLAAAAPVARSLLDRFLAYVEGATETALEELFTRTFDWNPTRCLEVGWHLYGEQYDRGAFLVRMRDRLRAAGIEEGTELPDHLGGLLRLLGRLPPAEGAALASGSLLPALDRMTKGFDAPEGEADNPYGDVVRAVRAAVASASGAAAAGGA